MKTLQNQTLLYDEDCPLCSVYTAGFIKAGMLDQNGKKPFSNLSADDLQIVDIKRASNEIALVDNINKTVRYGIDSLLAVIGNSFPIMEKAGRVKPLNYLLKKLYSFISYNRKVIIPNKNTDSAISCVPDFSYKYRFLYIAFSIAVTATMLYSFSGLITLIPNANFNRELLLATLQLLFQGMFLSRQNRQAVINYFGNLMTVSLMGSLLLIPIILLNKLIIMPEIIILVWFGLTVVIMFAEHFRRIRLLELPSYLCLTWVLYRLIALILLLNL